MSRQQLILKLMSDLDFFFNDLNRMIAEYDAPGEWETTATQSWMTHSYGGGIAYHGQHFYVSVPDYKFFTLYEKNGQKKQDIHHGHPYAMDLDKKNSLLYIANRDDITTYDLKKECTRVSSWPLPVTGNDNDCWGLKVDADAIFCTISNVHQIFICQTSNGKLLKKFGKPSASKRQGEFKKTPFGLAVNTNYLYVADHSNHRVQVLEKETGTFVSQWGENGFEKGQFTHPRSVDYDLMEDIFYVGDGYSVQLFRSSGECIQRIGGNTLGSQMNEFYCVHGVFRIEDQLYACDHMNRRILVFKRKQF